VSVNAYVAPCTAADTFDKAEDNMRNDATLQLVLQEIQKFRDELQQFRMEHTSVIQKVDRIEEKVDILERNLKGDDGHKVKDAFVPSKQQPTPTSNSDDVDAGVAKDEDFDIDFKFDDDDAAQHTFIPSLMDEV